ncbi:hypothetical protein ACFX15_023568 [Malus domestica]
MNGDWVMTGEPEQRPTSSIQKARPNQSFAARPNQSEPIKPHSPLLFLKSKGSNSHFNYDKSSSGAAATSFN